MKINSFENNGSKIVYVMILFSMGMAFISKLLEINFPRKMADFFIILIFIIFLLYRIKFYFNDRLILRKLFIIFIPIIIVNIIYIIFNLYSNRSLLSGSGFTGLAVNVFIFSYILLISKTSLVEINKIISYILIYHIIYTLFETLFLLMGTQFIFYDITSEYRHLPGILLNNFINTEFNIHYKGETYTYQFGGANGIFIAAQAASQLLLTSIIWFCPFYKVNITGVSQRKKIIYFLLSLFLFPLANSGLTLILLILSFVLILILFKQDLLIINKIIIIIIFGLFYLLFSSNIDNFLFYRLNKLSLSSKYYDIFMDPVFRFIELEMNLKIFGMQDNKTGLTYTDFGMGSLIWSSGLLMATVSIGMMIYLLGASFKAMSAITKIKQFDSKIAIGVYSLICIIWWLSTMHYLVSINVGGKQTFALFISALLIWNIKNE